MAVPAAAVAQQLRTRLPGLPTLKLHKLLYYCQGHHLAVTGDALFEETISAWDMGPVVGQLWHAEQGGTIDLAPVPLTESQLNTVGYVISRYGQLTGTDLKHLTHAEDPWRRADSGRQPGSSARIEPLWLIEWFARDAEDEHDEPGLLDSDEVRAWLSGASDRRVEGLAADDLEMLRARATRAV